MTADPAALERALSRTALSMRVQAGLDWGSMALATSALGAGLWQLCARRQPDTTWIAALLLGSTLMAGLGGMLWPIAVERSAHAIDRAGRLEGRVLAAVSFLREPAALRTPFMQAALRDAAQHARNVSARDAAPLHPPRAWWQALLTLLACVLAGVLLGYAPESALRLAAHAPKDTLRGAEPAHLRGEHGTRPVQPLLDQDELVGLRAEVDASATDPTLSPALREQLAAYASLLRRLTAPGLSDDDAIAQALALEAKLPWSEHAPDDDVLLRTLAAELRALAQPRVAAGARAQPTLSEALARELAEAARALRRLSADVRADKLPASQRAQLRAALERAREQERERLAQVAREDRERLLRDHQETPQGERSVLSRERAGAAQRALATLRRAPPRQSNDRALQQLSRDLLAAGDALAQQQREQAADALEQAGTDLDKLDERERESQQGRALARAVAQLRELLQRRAQAKHAPSPPSAQEGERTPHAATPSAATRRRAFQQRAEGDDEETDAGSASRHSHAPGQGAESQASPAATILLPGLVQQRVEVAESAGGGSEHDERHAATAPRPRTDVAYQDHLLRGVQGSGPTRSQVIRGAAGAGFATTAYRKVYGDYRAHAETVLERDQVPPGARFQVRRYFQLVRPREGQDAHD